MKLVGLAVLLLLLWGVNQTGSERIIVSKENRSPVKIRTIRLKGKEVEANKTFRENDDWLKELAVEVTNESEKAVTFVQIQLFFPRPNSNSEARKPGVSFTLDHGDNPFAYDTAASMPPLLRVKPLLRRESLEVALSDPGYVALSGLLIDTGFLVTTKVEISVNLIGFSDGTAWSGQMMQRSKGGWVPLTDPR